MKSEFGQSTQLGSFFIALVFAVVTYFISLLNFFAPLEQLLYDRLLRAQSVQYNDDVVIVAMDEKSLQTYGPLPWDRAIHAKLINQLTKAKVKAVGYDVLFNKTRGNDTALIDAVKKNNALVFPVVIEKVSQRDGLMELTPFPELYASAHAVGLVHYELSSDNIARSLYLKAGLGEPYWDAFSTEVAKIVDTHFSLPFSKIDATHSQDLTRIEQEHLVYIPFKKNADFMQKVSFVDLAETDEHLEKIKDKVVFVGVTATGARNADFLPVPIHRDGQIMPGVEINAVLYDALINENYILVVNKYINALVAGLLVFLFFNLLPKSLPKRNFYYVLSLFLVLGFFCWWLMHYQYRWLKLATPLIIISAGYLIWSWRKIVSNMRFFKQMISRLTKETKSAIQVSQSADWNTTIDFLSGLELIQKDKIKAISQDSEVASVFSNIDEAIKPNLTEKEKHLLNQIKLSNLGHQTRNSRKYYGVIEEKIGGLQDAITQINFLRRFVQQTMDRMSDGIILSDTNGKIFYSNILAKKYLPLLNDANNGRLFAILNELLPKESKSWADEIKRVLLSKVSSEVLATSNSGSDFKVNFSLLENVGSKDHLVFTLVDISDIKREQRRQLEMIDFISHDLRSPMTSILALVNRQKNTSEQNTEEKLNEFYKNIEKLTRSSLSMAEQFLMLSRAESQIEMPIYPVEILDTVDSALAVALPQARDKSIDLEFDFSQHEDIWIQANQDLLERIITNILSNAIKYSPSHSKVNILLNYRTSELELSVNDEGDGISQEQMDAIFKPFTRMQKHEVANIKGIGLGLRFVKAAMVRLGGRVTVDSELGKGSCFTLIFPKHLILDDVLDEEHLQ